MERVQLERDNALQDVSDYINEYGQDVKLFIRGESQVQRDKYNSMTSGEQSPMPPEYDFKVFPVDYTPNRAQMEKAGIREDCQCIIWMSMKDVIDRGLTFDSIENEKTTVSLDGNEWGVRDKNRVSQLGDQFMYLTMGLYKKP